MTHRYLDESLPEFWDFSFQDLGLFDQPALHDFILNKTKVQKLTYIGHSQGTSQMFAALSLMPEFFKDR